MWKVFEHSQDLYMIKMKTNNGYEVFLNDLRDIWYQSLSESTIQERFQEFNPLVEIKLEKIGMEVFNLVENISENSVDLVRSNDGIELKVKTKKSGFDLQFTFNLEKSQSDMFLKEMTVPLIQTVHCLEQQQKMLSDLIQKKDRELEEYKLERGEISRLDLKTEKFLENSLQGAHSDLMLNVFDSSEQFWKEFVQKFGDAKTNILEVQKDPWNHIKRKRKVYSSKTSLKKGKGINYANEAKK